MMNDEDNGIVHCVKEMQSFMLWTNVCSCGRKQWSGIVRWDDCRATITCFQRLMTIMLIFKNVSKHSIVEREMSAPPAGFKIE